MNAATAPTRKKETTPLEKIRPELNLEKWSIWQPSHSTNKGSRTLKRTVADKETGAQLTSEVFIGYVDKIGTLTTEEQKTCYGLIKYWEDSGRPTAHTFFSLKKLAKILKKNWGTNVIESLTQSLVRLRAIPIIWTNAYQDGRTKEVKEVLDPFNILSDLKIIRTRTDGHITKEAGYFQFNDFILRNLLANHTKPLFLDVVLNFKSDIALILYTRLDIWMSDEKTHYERRTKELFGDLGLEGAEYRKPSVRKRMLERALKELNGMPLSSGALISAALEKTKDDKDYKVVFEKKAISPAAVLPPAMEEHQASREVADTFAPPAVVFDHANVQAESLVKHFHKLLSGAEKNNPSSKEVTQATVLIAAHGEEKARFIVEYAIAKAPETGFKMATFGALQQYEHRAAHEYDRRQQEREATARREAERLEREELEREYYTTGRVLVDEFLKTYPPEQFQERIATKKQELLTKNLHIQPSEERLTKDATQEVRNEIAFELGVPPTVEEYYEQRKQGREVTPAPAPAPTPTRKEESQPVTLYTPADLSTELS